MSPDVDLSERELEILRLVATGASNKEIAHKLVISPNTVKVHLRNVFAKIGAVSRTEAALYALRAGLVDHLVQPVIPLEETSVRAAPSNGGLPEAETALAPLPVALAVPETTAARFRRLLLPLAALLAVALLVAGMALARINNDLLNFSPTPTAVVSLLEAQRWKDEVPLPDARSNMAALSYQTSIYVIGGETPTGVTGSILSIQSGETGWQELPAKPTPVADVQAALVGERIYVPGGRLAGGNPTSVLEVYDLRQKRWERRASLPVALSAYALAAVDGRLYLFGGWNGKQAVATIYSYDPETDTWQARTPLPSARAFTAAVALEGRIYLIGGTDGAHPLAIVQAYFPQRDQAGDNPWQDLAPLPEARSAVGAAVIAGLVYVFGGQSTDSPEGGLGPLQYQPLRDKWTGFDRSPVAIGGHPAMVALDTRLFVLGGLTPGGMSAFDQSYQAIYTISLPNIRQ